MQTLHRTLSDHGAGEPLRESPGKTAFTEDCLICNRAFTSWAAWACHASKIHRWRTATSVCAGTQGDSLCRGAARFSRNQRSFVGICCILKHAQVMCRTGWGSCVLGPDQAIPSIHTCTPPPALEGSCGRTIANTTRQLTAVVESKLALGHPDEDSVWDVVVDSVEPVETLKTTLRLWSQRLPARAENPSNCC